MPFFSVKTMLGMISSLLIPPPLGTYASQSQATKKLSPLQPPAGGHSPVPWGASKIPAQFSISSHSSTVLLPGIPVPSLGGPVTLPECQYQLHYLMYHFRLLEAEFHNRKYRQMYLHSRRSLCLSNQIIFQSLLFFNACQRCRSLLFRMAPMHLSSAQHLMGGISHCLSSRQCARPTWPDISTTATTGFAYAAAAS